MRARWRFGVAAALVAGTARWWSTRAEHARSPVFLRYDWMELQVMSPDVERIVRARARRQSTAALTAELRRLAVDCEKIGAGLLPAPVLGTEGVRWLFDTLGAELADRIGEEEFAAFRAEAFGAAREYVRVLLADERG